MIGAPPEASPGEGTPSYPDGAAEAIARLNKAIALCREKGDNGTRDILEHILREEEEAADWLESQLHIVKEVGKEAYLAEQIEDGD